MSGRTILAAGTMVFAVAGGVIGATTIVVSRADAPSPPPVPVIAAPAPTAPAVDQQQQARDAELLKQAYQAIVDAHAMIAKQTATAPAPAPAVAPAPSPPIVVPVPMPAPANTLVDISTILQPVLETLALIIAGFITTYVPKAIDAVERRTGVQFTEHQRQTILDAVKTAAGLIETKLDQKTMVLAQVHIDDPAVRAEACTVIATVPDAAAALGVTEASVARMIVGAANTRIPATPAQVAPNPLGASPGAAAPFVNPPL